MSNTNFHVLSNLTRNTKLTLYVGGSRIEGKLIPHRIFAEELAKPGGDAAVIEGFMNEDSAALGDDFAFIHVSTDDGLVIRVRTDRIDAFGV